MHFHLLAFEGPDAYARAGGIASRIEGLMTALAQAGHETHLWFIGDPAFAGHEQRTEYLHLHRWCQWISAHHPAGVYDGEHGKERDYARSLPPFLLEQHLLPAIARGESVAVLAEDWQTAHAMLHLDWLLRSCGVRERVALCWNANNSFGFDHIPWDRLAKAVTLTTVSRYMRQHMRPLGVDPLVIANGLGADAYAVPFPGHVSELRQQLGDRTVLAKVARFDPDKRWLNAVEITAELRREEWQPLLVARGGVEAHGADVVAHARALGLRIAERRLDQPGEAGLLACLRGTEQIDVLLVTSQLDAGARRLLLRGAHAVLANSRHEPFGLVGLETMAAGGLVCTGGTGEDYATPGRNSLAVQTDDPREFLSLFAPLRRDPNLEAEMRRAARRTARDYAWPEIVARNLEPQLRLAATARSALRRREHARGELRLLGAQAGAALGADIALV